MVLKKLELQTPDVPLGMAVILNASFVKADRPLNAAQRNQKGCELYQQHSVNCFYTEENNDSTKFDGN